MWLFRGAQSAVFYYLTCTPCVNAADRHKRKKEAFRAQKQQAKAEAVVSDQPRPFTQPTPFSTNPGWAEEIALGPGPPARRGRHRADRDRPNSSSSDQEEDQFSRKKEKGILNWMRYQREDEPLWGQTLRGSSVGISGRARPDDDESNKYFVPKVPPVNDLHPPIVCGPRSRAEVKWMLQPPPPAKVMAGKANYPPMPIQELPRQKPQEKPRVDYVEDVPLQFLEPDEYTRPTSPRRKISKVPNSILQSRKPLKLSSVMIPDDLFESESLASPPISELGSPRASWDYPETPLSRPWSGETYDSGSSFRSPVSKTLSAVSQRYDSKTIQLLRLEINDGFEDVPLGHPERVRRFRWSIDF